LPNFHPTDDTYHPHTRVRLLLCLVSTVLLMGNPPESAAQAAKLYPIDEAAHEPEFFSFRARLLQAAQARDTTFLYAALSPRILNSFGGDGGIDEFKSKWRPAEANSPLWPTLTEILSLGGAFHGDSLFTAPYTSSRFPPGLDSFEHVTITGAGVRVRQEPHDGSPVMTTLSFDVVLGPAEQSDERTGWFAVRLSDGRTGWVAAKYVRSPIDYRAGFARRDGRWVIRSLVAGD
jgi:hypothetical protein